MLMFTDCEEPPKPINIVVNRLIPFTKVLAYTDPYKSTNLTEVNQHRRSATHEVLPDISEL